MEEVYSNLFVGTALDYESLPLKESWRVVQACKDPYHREALGYKEANAPFESRERLVAIRDGRVILNMINHSGSYHSLSANLKEDVRCMIDSALGFIDSNIKGNKVLLHCNQGTSRSPTIALIYLKLYTDEFSNMSLQNSISYFKTLYSNYYPTDAMLEILEEYWLKNKSTNI